MDKEIKSFDLSIKDSGEEKGNVEEAGELEGLRKRDQNQRLTEKVTTPPDFS